MLGVAHVKDVNPLRLPEPCRQGYRMIKVALMDDGSVECFDITVTWGAESAGIAR